MSNWKENSAVKESYTLSRADTHSTFNDVERKRSLELTFSTTSGKDSATVPEIGKITSLDSPIKWSHMKNKFEIGHASLQRTTSEVFKEDNNFSKNQFLHENSEIYLKASNVKAFINKTLENRSQNGNKKLECSNNTLPKNFNSKETFKTLSNNDNYVCFQLYDRQLYKNTTSYNNHVYQPTEIRGPGSKSISKSDNKMDSPKTVQASCKPCNNSSTPNQYKPYSSRKDYNNLKVIKTAQIPYSNVRNFVVRNAVSNVTGSDKNTETAFPSFTEITGGHTKTGVIKNSINSSRNNNWDNLKMSKYSTMPISRTFNISERSKVSQLKEKFDHQFAEKLTDEKLHSDEKAGTELNTNRGLKRDKTACGNRKKVADQIHRRYLKELQNTLKYQPTNIYLEVPEIHLKLVNS
ncbi:uncharacterized protein LOC143228603 [Tachypleus tridentatus]|uniref:uncharacterized protein LOC143228603 n=1 Tax=Tachypleus tridentatus TaxID=6853 RepID=UPI003FD2385A